MYTEATTTRNTEFTGKTLAQQHSNSWYSTVTQHANSARQPVLSLVTVLSQLLTDSQLSDGTLSVTAAL